VVSADAHADAYPFGHANCDADTDRNAYRHAAAYRHASAYRHRYPDINGYADRECDAYPHAHPNAHS